MISAAVLGSGNLAAPNQSAVAAGSQKNDADVSGSLRISIVIPCFNAARYIGATLLSIVRQEFENLEVILVDGGSTDGTVDIALGFPELKAQVISEPDLGQLDAVQKGFKRASGDIYYWLNADDILMPGSLHYVNQVFVNEPEIDLVFSDDFAFDEETKQLYVGTTIRGLSYLDHLLFYRQMYSECVFWRASRTKLLPNSYFHLRLCTDYAFLLNLRYGLREKWVRKRLGAFRIVSGQISTRFGDRRASERAFIRRNMYDLLGWSPDTVWVRRWMHAPKFFIRQYVVPRVEAGLRMLGRIATGDKRRHLMTVEFFDVWLRPDSSRHVNASTLER
jgi:glycosyltransferase involved in cell wall biosynthesis